MVTIFAVMWMLTRALLFASAVVRDLLSQRFKDGSIVEAVIWKGKGAQRHRVVEQVS